MNRVPLKSVQEGAASSKVMVGDCCGGMDMFMWIGMLLFLILLILLSV